MVVVKTPVTKGALKDGCSPSSRCAVLEEGTKPVGWQGDGKGQRVSRCPRGGAVGPWQLLALVLGRNGLTGNVTKRKPNAA